MVVPVLYIAASIVGGLGLGEMALHPGRRPIPGKEISRLQSEVREINAQLEDVSIAGADGAVLRGWFVQPRSGNGHAVILLHGVSDNRMGMWGYGEWLLGNGYSVLLADARTTG